MTLDSYHKWVLLATLALSVILLSPEVAAQATEDNQMVGPLQSFHDEMRDFQTAISGMFLKTFWFLATMEFTLTFLILVIRGSDLNSLIGELFIRVLFIGFFWFLMQNGVAITDSIIRTLTELGAQASGSGVATLSPDSILDLGVDLLKRSYSNWSWTDVSTGFGIMVASIFCYLALVLIAANLALVLVEFYIIGFGGIFLLALGANRFTSGYAVAYLKYVFSTGVRIFITLVVAGIGYKIMKTRIDVMLVDNLSQLWALAGFIILLAFVTHRAPNAITGLLNGVNTSSSFGPGHVTQNVNSSVRLASNVYEGSKNVISTASSTVSSTVNAIKSQANIFPGGKK